MIDPMMSASRLRDIAVMTVYLFSVMVTICLAGPYLFDKPFSRQFTPFFATSTYINSTYYQENAENYTMNQPTNKATIYTIQFQTLFFTLIANLYYMNMFHCSRHKVIKQSLWEGTQYLLFVTVTLTFGLAQLIFLNT